MRLISWIRFKTPIWHIFWLIDHKYRSNRQISETLKNNDFLPFFGYFLHRIPVRKNKKLIFYVFMHANTFLFIANQFELVCHELKSVCVHKNVKNRFFIFSYTNSVWKIAKKWQKITILQSFTNLSVWPIFMIYKSENVSNRCFEPNPRY